MCLDLMLSDTNAHLTTEQSDNDFTWLQMAVEVAEASVIHNTMSFDVVCSITAQAKIMHEMKTKFNAKLITSRGHTFGQRLTFHRTIREYQVNQPELISFHTKPKV